MRIKRVFGDRSGAEDVMTVITPLEAEIILIGIYLFSLYFETGYKGFLVFSFWAFLISGLQIFKPFDSISQTVLIAFLGTTATLYSMLELKKMKNRGRKLRPVKRGSIIFGIILLSIFILLKLYYFDKPSVPIRVSRSPCVVIPLLRST